MCHYPAARMEPGYNEQEHKLILARGKLSLMGKMNQVHYILIEHLPCCENNVQDPSSESIYSFIVNGQQLTYKLHINYFLAFTIHEMSGDKMFKCFYHLIKPVSIKVFK